MKKSKITRDDSNDVELMYVKCAYCGKWVDVKPGRMNEVTHTLCKECLEKQMDELDRLTGKSPAS